MCSDREKSLNDSILSAINHLDGNFKHSKFRLDFYHLVTQPINKFVGALPKKSESFQDKVDIIRYWIKSLFEYVLTKEEFSVSLNRLENFIVNNGHILDGYFADSIKGLLQSLLGDIDFFANHFFKDTVTLGFIGSSIVEGMNQPLKFEDYACKPTMTIDKASENQLRLAENQARKRKVEKAKSINETHVWSRSKTKEYLTGYMEGIAVKFFDKRKTYCACCISPNNWLVANKNIFERFEYIEGVMTCKAEL
jgi:hypothetical protein